MTEQVKADFADQADELEAKGYRGLAAFLRLTDRRPKQDDVEVLIPTEIIDPPSKKQAPIPPAPAPRPVSSAHQAMRAAVAQRALAQGYQHAMQVERQEELEKKLLRMTPDQRRKFLRGGR